MATLLNWTPIFAGHMAWFIVLNGHQKDIFYNGVGVCAQNIDTILGSIVNITIGRAYAITQRREILL